MQIVRHAVFGGIYNNSISLQAVIDDARARGATHFWCLGDMGGFGPSPDAVFPVLAEHNVQCVQGNYDHSIGNALEDCACGYTDPRDNHFAQVSYDYTLANTSAENRAWLQALPPEIRLQWQGLRVLMAHGSPRRTNEFLWESTSPDHFLTHLLRQAEADVLFVTHTGIPWIRELPGGQLVVNVGAIGRPANDGRTTVWYAMVEVAEPAPAPVAPPAAPLSVSLVEVAYDHERLARWMGEEGLPAEFIETVRTGWWTTCVEILPAKERNRGRY